MAPTIDLILLGMVKEAPRSPYDLQKLLKERNITYWVKISRTSIYKKIQVLEERGYLQSKTERLSNMPEKTIYEITDEGLKYLYESMVEISNNELRFFIDYNAVLINLAGFDKAIQEQLLQNIRKNIHEFEDGVKQNHTSKAQVQEYGDAIIEQQTALAEAMSRWIDNFVEKR